MDETEEAQLTDNLIAVVKSAREQAGLTQKELAKRLRWKVRTVISIEHGTREIRALDVVKIGRACGVQNPETLFRRWLRW